VKRNVLVGVGVYPADTVPPFYLTLQSTKKPPNPSRFKYVSIINSFSVIISSSFELQGKYVKSSVHLLLSLEHEPYQQIPYVFEYLRHVVVSIAGIVRNHGLTWQFEYWSRAGVKLKHAFRLLPSSTKVVWFNFTVMSGLVVKKLSFYAVCLAEGGKRCKSLLLLQDLRL